uniref:Succinate dehydrogenase [ubiquinone] cytochrome b small subunit n=1 Tax=Parascaris equorum TaxID=6256 RepID=A0A914S6L3_PAREQ
MRVDFNCFCRAFLIKIIFETTEKSVIASLRCINEGRQLFVCCYPEDGHVNAEKGFKPLHNHGTLFKIERYFAAAMVPLMPAAYFIHGREMDLCLALALSLHIHWGVWGVVNKLYIGVWMVDTLAAAVRVGAYIFTACLLAGLLYFNEHDVGLTRAFEMVWEL